MIKIIVFDLDNTLFDTYGQLGVKVLDKMIERMKKAGLNQEQEKFMRKKYIQTGFRTLANHLGLSDEIRQIGMSTYIDMDLSQIKPFDDVELIKEFKQKKILVTSGVQEVQSEKIRILGVTDLFDEVIIDPVGSSESRQEIFSNLFIKHKLKPEEAMVVGDNADAEIAAGKKLGMTTAQMLRRPFLKGKADYYVKDLYEVKKILKKSSISK